MHMLKKKKLGEILQY